MSNELSHASIRFALAQLDFLVGDIPGNTALMMAQAVHARDALKADVIIFPELSLTGYPPEDLLLRPSLQRRVHAAIEQLKAVQGITLVFGLPEHTEIGLQNSAWVMRDGQRLARYTKQQLPNHEVFDERRYFVAGTEATVFDLHGLRIGLSICEDIWHPGPARAAKAAGAELLINLNASPFHAGKAAERLRVVGARARELDFPVLYCNVVGGQDELIFDGGSFALQASGDVAMQAPLFRDGLYQVDVDVATRHLSATTQADLPELHESIYQALVLAVRDYVNKSGFKGVVLGLSGGIDSALTLAIAVDALGAERVRAVMMPYHYTADISRNDAAEQAARLGVHYSSLPIAPMVEAFSETLSEMFAGLGKDKTEENLQARSRGVLLMAISNKLGYLVLTTGNKSEMSVGYATLYGDMAGGFAVIKDVPKVVVFELCRWRNAQARAAGELDIVPQRVIDRPPSAELAPDQKDEDSLPPYPVLDEILRRYIECDESAHDIIAAGFEAEQVRHVLRLVDINEYKRRQAAVGPRISRRGFGKDRRYPIVNGWQLGD
ncbi:MAG: NAD+ synthase [Paraperlucidibaca sp.]